MRPRSPSGLLFLTNPIPERPARHGHERHAPGRGHRAGLRHPPAPVPRLRSRDAEYPRADATRHVGRPREHHAPHHGPRLGVRHDGQDPGAARHLRFPQPQGHQLRWPVDRHGRRDPGAGRVGRPRGTGAAFAADRRAPSFPPPKTFPGWRVGCFLTPPSATSWAFPAELETEIVGELGEGNDYIFDIPDFRRAGYDVALDQVFKMTERRFRVGRKLAVEKPWDFFMLCEIAPDRLHHVFWQHWDPRHPLYEAGNRYESAFQDYYRFLDVEVGKLLEVLPEDAITIVMSDHGARPMMGGICFNDWLIKER